MSETDWAGLNIDPDDPLSNPRNDQMSGAEYRVVADRLLREERFAELLVYLRKTQDNPDGKFDISVMMIAHMLRDSMSRMACVVPVSKTSGPLCKKIHDEAVWLSSSEGSAFMFRCGFSDPLRVFVRKMARYVLSSGKVIRGLKAEIASEKGLVKTEIALKKEIELLKEEYGVDKQKADKKRMWSLENKITAMTKARAQLLKKISPEREKEIASLKRRVKHLEKVLKNDFGWEPR